MLVATMGKEDVAGARPRPPATDRRLGLTPAKALRIL